MEAVDCVELPVLLLLHHLLRHLQSLEFRSCSLRGFLREPREAKAPAEPATTETYTSVSHPRPPHHPSPAVMQRRCWFIRPPLPPPLLHHHGLESTLGVHAPPLYRFVETLRAATSTVCFLSPLQMSFLMVRGDSLCYSTHLLYNKDFVHLKSCNNRGMFEVDQSAFALWWTKLSQTPLFAHLYTEFLN